jgi:hypothetical protein
LRVAPPGLDALDGLEDAGSSEEPEEAAGAFRDQGSSKVQDTDGVVDTNKAVISPFPQLTLLTRNNSRFVNSSF